ncbi:MAG: hypothetical protein AAGK47_10095, partial [Bacteroidota bacterium]
NNNLPIWRILFPLGDVKIVPPSKGLCEKIASSFWGFYALPNSLNNLLTGSRCTGRHTAVRHLLA